MVSQLTGRTPGGGNKVALVLGSGGARGYAHIGVIEALEARGFEIISIAGCSMGALIGGIYASAKLPGTRKWMRIKEGGPRAALNGVIISPITYSGAS